MSPIASPRVCWGVQIIASSVLKFRKCLTLFYLCDSHVLWALRLINKIQSYFDEAFWSFVSQLYKNSQNSVF